MTGSEWQVLAKGMLKAEVKRRNLTYQGLSARLAEIGVSETPRSLRTKVSRGGFSAVFLVRCLRAMGCRTLRLDDA